MQEEASSTKVRIALTSAGRLEDVVQLPEGAQVERSRVPAHPPGRRAVGQSIRYAAVRARRLTAAAMARVRQALCSGRISSRADPRWSFSISRSCRVCRFSQKRSVVPK